MVPASFTPYFTATATAAGALIGLLILFDQNDQTYIYVAAFLMIGQVGGALSRAWSLVEGRHLAAAPANADSAAAQGESSAP